MNPPKSPGIAALASFLWPGAGHIYCGAFGWFFGWILIELVAVFGGGAIAFAIFAGTSSVGGGIGGIAFFYLLLVALHFGQIFHAYNLAEAYNKKLAISKRGRSRSRGRDRHESRRGRERKKSESSDDVDALKQRVRDLEEIATLKEQVKNLERNSSGVRQVGTDVDQVDVIDDEIERFAKTPKKSKTSRIKQTKRKRLRKRS
jgi:hypothetical protein